MDDGNVKKKKGFGGIAMSILRVALGVAGGICSFAAGWIYFHQTELTFNPNPKLICVPSKLKIEFEDVYLDVSPGVRINGWFVPVTNAVGTLLFCRPNAANMSYDMDTLEFFKSAGLNVFVFDYRGFAKSTGKPTEKGVYEDAQAAYNYLVTARKIDSARIILFGRAMGGAVAAHTARLNKVGGVVIEAGYTSMGEYMNERYGSKWAKYFFLSRFDTVSELQKVHFPVLIVHSPGDNSVPFHFGRELFAGAKEPKEFLEVKGYHGDAIYASRNMYTKSLKSFLDKCLPK